MNYPQHPEKKQRNMRLNPEHFWGVWDEMCSDELSDDESVTTILTALVVAALVLEAAAALAALAALVAASSAVFSCNNNF